MTEHKSRIWASVKDRPLPKESIQIDIKLSDGSILTAAIYCVMHNCIEWKNARINTNDIIWWRYAK
jgi:hypothetical protein